MLDFYYKLVTDIFIIGSRSIKNTVFTLTTLICFFKNKEWYLFIHLNIDGTGEIKTGPTKRQSEVALAGKLWNFFPLQLWWRIFCD